MVVLFNEQTDGVRQPKPMWNLVHEHGGLPRRPVVDELSRDGPEFFNVESESTRPKSASTGLGKVTEALFEHSQLAW